jgi:hypothetical protein
VTRPDLSGANRENITPIEHACMRAVCKPWGCTDLRPWSEFATMASRSANSGQFAFLKEQRKRGVYFG